MEWIPDPARIPVLVIEDSPETVTVYKSFLKDSEFQLGAAGTTREAEELLEKVQPRAIVLDIVLRSEDTWGFLARLKEDSRTRDIPVIVASTVEDQAKAYHLGAGPLSDQAGGAGRTVEESPYSHGYAGCPFRSSSSMTRSGTGTS